MRLEPLLTLEVRHNIRRAVSELNDIQAILESMGDSATHNAIHKGVLYSQESLIDRIECETKRLADALLHLKHARLLASADYNTWLEGSRNLHQP